MEEKQLYELKIIPRFEKALPPLQEGEISLLRKSVLEDGCRDALVVFQGALVDGHNRYRICHENEIPFAIKELDRANEDEAFLWLIENQLGRRNVPDFIRCELILPLESAFREEARKRMYLGKKSEATNPMENFPQGSGAARDELAKIIGMSGRNLEKAKKLLQCADEYTLSQLRSGELSIHGAYTKIFNPEKFTTKDGIIQRVKDPERKSVMPGYGLVVEPDPTPDSARIPPPDSVYDIPPIKVFGNCPPEDMKLRGEAEFIQAKSDLEKATNYYLTRAKEIIHCMSGASAKEEYVAPLREIVTNGYQEIMRLLEEEKNG